MAVLPYHHDPYDPWPCCHTITTHGRVAIPSRPRRPMAVLPYHHDPWPCCHTITTHGRVAIPSRPMPVLPYRHDFRPLCCHTGTMHARVAIPSRFGAPWGPLAPPGPPPHGAPWPPLLRCVAALKGRL